MITKENLRNAVDEFVDNMFQSVPEKGWGLYVQRGLASYMIEMNFDMVDAFLDKDGFINVDMLEKSVLPQLNKVGVIQVGAFTLRNDDFTNFFNTIRKFDNGEN